MASKINTNTIMEQILTQSNPYAMKANVEDITEKLRSMYDIEVKEEEIYIHNPICINIQRDDNFRIEDGMITLRMINKKVVVNLWKDILNMHITVLD